MAGTRKRHSASFKAKVALEAAKQTRTVAELAKVYQTPPRPDQPVEEATPRRRRVPLPRRSPPGPRRQPGDPGRTLRADRTAQHGSRVVEEKRCPLRLTPSGPSSEPGSSGLSIARQCELIDLNRSTFYLPPATESEANLRLMRLIDEQYLKTPFYGSRRMTAVLQRSGEVVNRKRVQRLMRLMGLEGLHPRPRTTIAEPGVRAYPYLLRDRVLTRPRRSLEFRHHLRADATGIHVPDGGDRLVQPLRAVVAAVEHAGGAVLPGGAGGGVGSGPAGDLQHRPGLAVHLARVHRPAGGGRGSR